MKKLFLLCCVALLATQFINAQTITPAKPELSQALHDSYIEKYKSYKTAGRVLLGSGIGMILGGGIAVASYANQDFNGVAPTTAETLLIIIGPATALASIPFFMLAKKNKAKAALSIKGESVTFGNKNIYQSNYIALALKIKL